jgi:hypothetical protein
MQWTEPNCYVSSALALIDAADMLYDEAMWLNGVRKLYQWRYLNGGDITDENGFGRWAQADSAIMQRAHAMGLM